MSAEEPGKAGGLSIVEGSLIWGSVFGLSQAFIHAARNGKRPAIFTATSMCVWTGTMATFYGAKGALSWASETIVGSKVSRVDAALGSGGMLGSLVGVYNVSHMQELDRLKAMKGSGLFSSVARSAAVGICAAMLVDTVDDYYIRWKTRQAVAMNRPDLGDYVDNLSAPEDDPIDSEEDWFLNMCPRWFLPVSDPRAIKDNKERLVQIENELTLIDIKLELHRRGLDFHAIPEKTK